MGHAASGQESSPMAHESKDEHLHRHGKVGMDLKSLVKTIIYIDILY